VQIHLKSVLVVTALTLGSARLCGSDDAGGVLALAVGGGVPGKASLSLAYLHGRQTGSTTGLASHAEGHKITGYLVEVAGGLGAGQLSVGKGVDDEILAASLKASVLRTWGSPSFAEPRLTYVGPEADLTFLFVRVNVGVLFKVQGVGGSRALVLLGAGIRLPKYFRGN
jgi:hypothetical protein